MTISNSEDKMSLPESVVSCLLSTNDDRPSSTIWVDVTTIVRWDRPIVGVVRVEEQLARWILDRAGESIRFCRYDLGLRAFLDVNREDVVARIRFFEQFEGRNTTSPATAIKIAVSPGRGGAPSNEMPQGSKPPKKPRTFLARLLRKLKKRLRRGSKPVGNQTQLVPPHAQLPLPETERVLQPLRTTFSPGDVYISVGSDWDDKDLRHLYEHKHRFQLKVIGICYDTIPIKFPHLTLEGIATRFPKHLADLAWVADHVMCISRCTQRDFLEFTASIGAPSPATSVLRLGSNLLKVQEGDEPRVREGVVTEIVKSPFVLFVSTIERRKNHQLLYQVWVRLVEAGCKVPDLVFVGMHGWGVNDLLDDLRRDRRVKGRIHVLHGISDVELAFLYKHCEYTVYPSLYEGWGLPVVESFAFGKFCLCSNAGSLTEAGDDLAEFLDPWDITGWSERIRYFSEHPTEVEARNKRVKAAFKSHSWRETSSSILQRAQELVQLNAASRSV